MPETVGTLDLKIACLEHWLKLLEQRQAMSEMYPTYRANLAVEDSKVRGQLHQLIQHRERLLTHLIH